MSDGGLLALNLAEARDGLARKAFSARDLAVAYNDAVAETKALNAYITPTPEHALAMADAADERLARGEALPLDGIPIAVKDLFCTRDILTTAGSHILDGFRPPYESTVTEKLWRVGAVMLGKANLDEFAMGSSTTTSWYGPVENPWRRSGDNRPLVPGGSSGGSAAAVAGRAGKLVHLVKALALDPEAEAHTVVACKVRGGLGGCNDVVGRQRIFGHRQADLDRLGASRPQPLDALMP